MNLLEQQKNPALDFDMSKSVANTFDLNKAAGPMEGASGISVNDSMLASKQLEGILSRDNSLLQKARARAGAASARRGLLNSSIGVEAGESAMIDVAAPLAQMDAGTNYNAAQFNASAANDFARDNNNFGRQSAMARFGQLANLESEGRRMTFDSFERGAERTFQGNQNLLERQFRSGESALDRTFQSAERQADRTFQRDERLGSQAYQAGENAIQRAFQTGERIGTQDFQAVQATLDRAQQLRIQQLQEQGMDTRQATQIAASEREAAASRVFTAEQAQVDRQFRSTEADLNRQFDAAQRGLDRQQQVTLQTNSQEWQAAQNKLNQQFQMDFEKFRLPMNMMASFTERMQGFVTQVMSDPNLTPEARSQAIANYQAYSQQTMGWMSNFFGQAMPNTATGGVINPVGAPGTSAQQPGGVQQGGAGVGPGADIGVPRPTPAPTAPGNVGGGGGIDSSPGMGIPGGMTARDIYTSGDEELIRRYRESLA